MAVITSVSNVILSQLVNSSKLIPTELEEAYSKTEGERELKYLYELKVIPENWSYNKWLYFLVSFCAYLGRKKPFLAKPFAMKILKKQQFKGKKEQENKVLTVLAFFRLHNTNENEDKKAFPQPKGTDELEVGERRGFLISHSCSASICYEFCWG